jgi:5-bromo-4-chloroindolyl phosphate hydrolysis protein
MKKPTIEQTNAVKRIQEIQEEIDDGNIVAKGLSRLIDRNLQGLMYGLDPPSEGIQIIYADKALEELEQHLEYLRKEIVTVRKLYLKSD